jgi:hypothetical protein
MVMGRDKEQEEEEEEGEEGEEEATPPQSCRCSHSTLCHAMTRHKKYQRVQGFAHLFHLPVRELANAVSLENENRGKCLHV